MNIAWPGLSASAQRPAPTKGCRGDIKSIRKRSAEEINSIKPMRVARGRSQSLCIAVLLLTGCALSAQNLFAQNPVSQNNGKEDRRVRNIVLGHGAWADGSGWKGVYDILVKDGYNVSIVQEPETSFEDDVTATKRVLALQDGPCIAACHS